MDLVAIVREAASSMKLVDEGGKLKKLDSLTVIDFVVELERASGLEIPSTALRSETFESIETIAEMLEELKDDR